MSGFEVALLVTSGLLYLFFLAPTIYWRDAAEFVVHAHALGIAHPTGSPTYALIAKLFAFLPFGSIAFRVNLASAFFGMLTLALLFRNIVASSRLLNGADPSAGGQSTKGMAMAAALLFMVSQGFWKQAEMAEVYTQQTFWLTLLISLMLRIRSASVEERPRLASLAALLFGLSTGTHGFTGLYLPGFLVYLALAEPSLLRSGRQWAALICFFLLGFSVYLYLPLRSATNPILDWGNTDTWKGFFYHLTDKKDSIDNLTLPASTWHWGWQLRNFAGLLPPQLSYVGLGLAAFGCGLQFRRDRTTWWLYTMIFLIHFGFFIRFWISDFGFLPTFLILAHWMGLGLTGLARFFEKALAQLPSGVARTRPSLLLGVGIVAGAFLVGLTNRLEVDRSDYRATHRFGRYVMQSVEERAVLFDQQAWFPLIYFQSVESLRPDVDHVLRNSLLYPALFYYPEDGRYPRLVFPDRARAASPDDYLRGVIEANRPHRPVYWYQVDHTADGVRLSPRGIVFEAVSDEEPILEEGSAPRHIERLYQFYDREFRDPAFWSDGNGREIHALNLIGLSMFYLEQHLPQQALLLRDLAERVDATSFPVANNSGVLYDRLGQMDKAEASYRRALELQPQDAGVRVNLAVVLHNRGRPAEAIPLLEEVLAAEEDHPTALYYLGKARRALYNDEELFRKDMQRVLELAGESRWAERARQELQSLPPPPSP